MQTIAITGGTGLVGKVLTNLLVSKSYKVIVFSRTKANDTSKITYANWDIKKNK